MDSTLQEQALLFQKDRSYNLYVTSVYREIENNREKTH